ncbi:hypothetical protein ACQ4LE_010260 [Meloidogyne hapla]
MKNKNDSIQIIILIFGLIIRQSKSSICVVSKWRQWGECQGDCEFALRVRNRDVIKPPFPEKDEKTSQIFLRECPQLYQVEQCLPRECVDESPFNRLHTDATTQNLNNNKTKVFNNEENINQITPSTALLLKQQKLKGERIKENINLDDPFNHNKNDERKNRTLGILEILKDEGPFSTRIDLINNRKQIKINKIDCKYPNPACCRSTRQKCANGRKPAQLTRWYRKKGEQFCRPYKYPFCEDSVERTFAAESECKDLCFTEQEKTVLPDFRVIR